MLPCLAPFISLCRGWTSHFLSDTAFHGLVQPPYPHFPVQLFVCLFVYLYVGVFFSFSTLERHLGLSHILCSSPWFSCLPYFLFSGRPCCNCLLNIVPLCWMHSYWIFFSSVEGFFRECKIKAPAYSAVFYGFSSLLRIDKGHCFTLIICYHRY